MATFLLLTLYAPLASWGDVTVGENRSSWDRPSRSAVLGLLAAALGIVREDQSAHDALDRGYAIAVRLDIPGSPMVDYHTIQTVAENIVRKRRPATRKQLLGGTERETILSRRSYRADSLATAAVWASDDAKWPLNNLRVAIRRPNFVLYAGRKSNPFALPIDPQIVEAPDLVAAFAMRPAQKVAGFIELEQGWSGKQRWGSEVSYDVSLPAALRPATVLRRETRRDTAPDRKRWHFSERTVEVARLPVETGQNP